MPLNFTSCILQPLHRAVFSHAFCCPSVSPLAIPQPIAFPGLWHSLLWMTIVWTKLFIVFQGIPGQSLSVYYEEIIFPLSSQDLRFFFFPIFDLSLLRRTSSWIQLQPISNNYILLQSAESSKPGCQCVCSLDWNTAEHCIYLDTVLLDA